MQETTGPARTPLLSRAPRELINILGTAGALFAVVAVGALISATLPPGASVWLSAAAYLVPASIAFVGYWWVAQRL
ncbi:MAG: hypothetical protein ABI655_08260 [Phenylobacterium sp.]